MATARTRLEVRFYKTDVGSTLRSLFDELGETEELDLLTQKKLLAAKVQEAMVRKSFTQAALARAMKTSRSAVHRLLDPTNTGVTFETIWKASSVLGVKLVTIG